MMAGYMQGFGNFERDDNGRLCYRPAVPPFPKLEDVWEGLARAIKAIEAFDHALDAFPLPGVVGRLFARLDAVHSSGAEGSTTTFTDLMEFQTILRRARDPEDAREVSAAAQAFDGLAMSDAAPRALVLDIHHRLFHQAKAPAARSQAGLWKTTLNATYDPDLGGFFYYSRPESLADLMAQWEIFTMTEGDGKPELLRQALSHWLFEHIHPVHDGNGRAGRLLVPILMRRKGGLRHASAFLGEAVHLNKAVYIDAMKDGRRTGNFALWCRVFCSLAMQTATSNLDRLERLGAIHARWLAATRGVRAHSVVHDLIPWVLTTPRFTVRDALGFAGNRVSFVAMNSAIKRLEGLGIVRQATTAGNERIFSADDVMALFEPTTEMPT